MSAVSTDYLERALDKLEATISVPFHVKVAWCDFDGDGDTFDATCIVDGETICNKAAVDIETFCVEHDRCVGFISETSSC